MLIITHYYCDNYKVMKPTYVMNKVPFPSDHFWSHWYLQNTTPQWALNCACSPVSECVKVSEWVRMTGGWWGVEMIRKQRRGKRRYKLCEMQGSMKKLCTPYLNSWIPSYWPEVFFLNSHMLIQVWNALS